MPSPPAPAPNNSGGVNDRDYLDKGLDALEKKLGGPRFADPSRYRAANEKVTDFLRKVVEKVTGKKVPAKVSN